MSDLIITPSSGKIDFIYQSGQEISRLESITIDPIDGLVFSGKISASSVNSPLNITATSSNINYPFIFASSGETGAKSLLMDSAGGTYNPSTNLATVNITGTSSWATNAVTNANLTGDVTSVGNATTIANSVVTNAKLTNSSVTIGSTAISLGATASTIAGLTSVTSTTFVGALTGTATTASYANALNAANSYTVAGITGNLTGTATTASYANNLNAANQYTVGGITGSHFGTSSWATNATNALTATNATQLNGQAASYYTNIPARLGYTPVDKAGDTVTGNLIINGNFSVNGSFTAFSASNVYISSSQLYIEDNILTLNAFSPYLRYAGIEMYDSGSGTLSSLLWDGESDYFFLSGSSVNGKIITGPDSQANLSANFVPKATAGYKLGNSIIYDDGTNIGIGITTPVYKTEIYSGVKTSAFTGLSISNFNNYDGTDNSLVKSQLRFAILENPISTFDASQRTFAILESGNEANNSSSDGFFAISTRLNGAVAEKFRITSTGNVGIGTTNPAAKLYINASGSSINLLRGVTYNDSNASFNNASLEYYDTSTSNASTVTKINYNAYFNKRGTANITGYTVGNFNGSTQIDSGSVNLIWDYSSRIEIRNQATASSLVHFVADSGYVTAQGGVLGKATDRIGFFVRSQNQSALTLTNQYGIYIEDLGQSTNNYAFYSNVSAASNKYNIYAAGTANNYFAGYVGIGATSFVYGAANRGLLEVYGSSDALIALRNDTANFYIHKSGNNFAMVNGGAGYMTFNTNGSDRLYIDSNGYIGIATTSILTTGGNAQLSISTNTTAVALSFGASNNDMSYIRRLSAGVYQWQTYNSGNTGQIHLQPYGGSVGIGTTSPSSTLHVNSTTAAATLLRADGTSGTLFSVVDDLSDSLMSVNNSAGLPVLEVFADDRIVAGQYGQNDFVVVNNKVGIGTNNPLTKLHVTSSASIPSAIFMGGNVGIGITVPTTPLHVVGVISGSSFTGAGTGLTGTAVGLSIGGTAATVTTNANLTGHITSTGNATLLGSFTSAQLLAALTDETGTGASVFANSPTLVTPALGTPSSGVLTNCTGTAAGLSIGGTAATASYANALNAANNYTVTGITGNLTGNVTGTATTASYANALNAANSYTVTGITGNLTGNVTGTATTASYANALNAANSYTVAGITGALTGTSSWASNAVTSLACTGNAGTVTNGVYTTGNQSIAGTKTFTGVTSFSNTSDYQIVLDGSGGTWAGINWSDVNGVDYMWFNGQNKTFSFGGVGSNVSGKKLHVDGGVTIGADYDATVVPSNGLSIQGGVQIGNYSTYVINTLAASGTQSRTFEIARLGIDYNDWNNIGTFEVEIHEKYYSQGLKKVYNIWYGYPSNSGSRLVELRGTGDNNFQCRIGSQVQISGDSYYLPVYVDIKYYSIVDVVIKTNRNITTTTNPEIGYTYINIAPTPTNISSFTADSDLEISTLASAKLGGNTILTTATTSATGLSIGGTAATASYANALNAANNYTVAGITGNLTGTSSWATNAVTALNVGNGTITIAGGTGVGVGSSNTFTTNQSGATTVTITNTGVTSAVAGTGVSVTAATGPITFSIGQAVGTAATPTFASVSATTFTGALTGTATTASYANALNAANSYTVGAVTMSVIKQSTTLYAGTDITDDDSTRTVYFNIPGGGYSPAKYFKVARIKITGNYQNVSLNGYFTAVSSGVHVGSERKVEFDFIAYAATNAGAPTVTYLKRGPDTTNVLVYAVANGGGAGTTYYDVYIKNAWYNDTNGELAIRVGYGSAVTIWQAGLDSGTSAPVDTLVNANSNYAFDTTGNVGIGTTSPVTKLETYRLESTNRTTTTDILTINADANTSPYSGHGGTILFRGCTYSGTSNNAQGNRKWGQIGMYLTDAYDNFSGENMFFAVASDDRSDTLTTAMTIQYNGNIGIGVTTPTQKLEVAGYVMAGESSYRTSIYGNSGGAWIGFGDTSNTVSLGRIGAYGSLFNINSINGDTSFQYNGSEKMRITTDGLVGIGTTVPSTLLHAYGSDGRYFTYSGTSGAFTIQRNAITTGGATPVLSLINTQGMDSSTGRGTSIQLDLGYGGSASVVGTAARGARIATLGETVYDATAANQNAVLAFFTSTAGSLTEKLRIRSDGSLSPITVSSTTAGATLLRTDGTNGTLFSVVDDLSDSLMSVNNSAGLPVLEVFADDRIVGGQYGQNDFVVVNNKVGIGTNNPLAKLHVTSSTSIPSAIFMGGNVGIGTSSPANKLYVNGDGYFASTLYIADNTALNLGNTSQIYHNSARGATQFTGTSGGDTMCIKDSNGYVGIGLTLPTAPLHVVGVISGSSFTGAGTGLTGTAANLTVGTASALSSMNISQFTNNSGYLTSVTNISGNAATATIVNGTNGQLLAKDIRAIAPNNIAAGYLQFGFTTWTNTLSTTPYADYLHLRSYADSSGGNDNLIMFNKSVIGMRIWQQTFGSATNYSSYKDVCWTDGTNASGTWAITSSWATNAVTSLACTGNAATVTNGVYTTGVQSIAGNKTFTGTTIVTGSIETAAVRETFSAVSSTTTVSIDLSTATVFNLTFTSTISAFNITNVNTSRVNSFTLITLPNGAGATIAWSFQTNGGGAANVKWASNVSPTATTTNGRFDIFSFVYNGTNWYGFTGGQNYV